MNINKKFDRVKQWAGEKMGAEAKTNVSDQFKGLETEMNLRHEGMERLHKSMTVYVKSLSTRSEGEDKEKRLPIGYMGQMMIQHGEDFDSDSEFGRCLISMGRANDRVARYQESYVSNATCGWLESLERSLAMMKEYQAARKKLENRRLAYDASLSKMQKSKKEDFRMEEELRSQKAKYEESSEDVLRRMQDIKEAEADSLADLGQFLEAELEYYDRCRDELIRLKRDWPAGQSQATQRDNRRITPRSRSNTTTAHVFNERMASHEEAQRTPEAELRPPIRSQTRLSSFTRPDATPVNSYDDYSEDEAKVSFRRSNTIQTPKSLRESNNVAAIRQNSDVAALRAGLRPTSRANLERQDVFGDPSDNSTMNSMSPDRSCRERSVSPATSNESTPGRNRRIRPVSLHNSRKGPPPPPPNRSKKPPPPPVKRTDIITAGYKY
ncbi:Meiotically up-regulated protein [Erysiphe necator]|uniref:Putative bar domain-containing protein n=1 Tax=Uncinula necator TaxID=52586 RepID=A0A0B1P701_UNCNE|nr:Meiotically up-regulated protein [Erysiphe necator]KHJ33120.1 putative bar domain-containing protein [Erysiphe necator]